MNRKSVQKESLKYRNEQRFQCRLFSSVRNGARARGVVKPRQPVEICRESTNSRATSLTARGAGVCTEEKGEGFIYSISLNLFMRPSKQRT